jgi:predicted small integral membrane protein DUF2165
VGLFKRQGWKTTPLLLARMRPPLIPRWSTVHMISRLSKTLLVAASAFYYTLVVFNNLTDYNSNYQFVHHVLLMDSTFPGNRGMWRAIQPPWSTRFSMA